MNYETFYKRGEAATVSFSVYTKPYTEWVEGVADHICYKCSSNKEFETIRAMYEAQGAWIYQSIISGRRIAFIKLPQGYATPWGPVNYMELADQKPDDSQESHWDHIEIMVPDYDSTIAKLREAGKEIEEKVRPHHTTHQIILPIGFRFVFTRELLINKIRLKEMKPR